MEEAIGYPISRIEAMDECIQVLRKAEQERLDLAEQEAERGIQWKDYQ